MSEPTEPTEPPAPPDTAPEPCSLARIAFSGAAWLAVLNGLAGLAMFGLVAWLNRALPDAPSALGTWYVVVSLVLMTSLMLDGGIPLAIMQRTDLHPGALAALAWLQILLGLAGTSCVFLGAVPLARVFAQFPQEELAAAFRLASPAILLIALGEPPKALLQKALRFRLVAMIESGSTLVLIVIAFAFARGGGIDALILALLARHACETLLYWGLGDLRAAQLLVRFDMPAVAERLRFGIAMGLQSMLGTAMRQGDRLLVGLLAGPVAVNLYQQIQNVVVQPFSKLSVHVARAAFPTFARSKDDPDRLLRGLARMQRMLALCIFPTLAGMAAVAPRMLHVLLGDKYEAHLPVAALAFQILCVGTIVFNYGYASGVALNAIGLSRPMLSRQVVGGLAVGLLILAGSPWGLVGISVGRSLASVVIACLFLDLARRVMGFSGLLMREGVREALPASLACFVLAAGVGIAADHVLPASSAFAGPDARSLGLFWTVLLCQVAVGMAAYVATLMLRGIEPLAELRNVLPRPARS